MDDFDNPNPELVKKLNQEIAKSGYPLEWEAAKILETNLDSVPKFFIPDPQTGLPVAWRKWQVSRHSHYADPQTGELRETDLRAEFSRTFSSPETSVIFSKILIIECKQSAEHSWVFLTEPSPEYCPRNSFNINEINRLGDDFVSKIMDVTHYCKATRCCYNYYSFGSSKDTLRDAFYQASKASYASRAGSEQSLSLTDRQVGRNYLNLYCPIVVFRGNIFEYRFDSASPSVIPARHAMASLQLYLGNTTERIEPVEFLIDVVRVDYLPDFVKLLKDETRVQTIVLDEDLRWMRNY